MDHEYTVIGQLEPDDLQLRRVYCCLTMDSIQGLFSVEARIRNDLNAIGRSFAVVFRSPEGWDDRPRGASPDWIVCEFDGWQFQVSLSGGVEEICVDLAEAVQERLMSGVDGRPWPMSASSTVGHAVLHNQQAVWDFGHFSVRIGEVQLAL